MSFDVYNSKISEASVKDLVEYVNKNVAYAYTSAKQGIDNANPYAVAAAMAELKKIYEFTNEWRRQLEK